MSFGASKIGLYHETEDGSNEAVEPKTPNELCNGITSLETGCLVTQIDRQN